MSKSLGNFVTIQDLVEKGYDALALRYLILTSHYRKGLNYSEKNLKSAAITLDKLRSQVSFFKSQTQRTTLSQEKSKKIEDYNKRFEEAMSDDVNTPQALAVLWEMVRSNVPSEDKYDLAVSFDEVFGFNLRNISQPTQVPEEIDALIKERELLRAKKKWADADAVRKKIEKLGYLVEDAKEGPRVKEVGGGRWEVGGGR